MPRWSLAFAFALSACFSDAPATGACAVGSKGCACTSGGACDAGLECHAASQLCFDPECERGAADCLCLDGECVGELVCIDDYCQSPPSGTMDASADDPSVADASVDASASDSSLGSSADNGETTLGTASATDTDPSNSASVGDASADVDTGPMTSASDDASTATGGSDACLGCMLESSTGACMTQYDDCFPNAECNDILTCVFENGNPAMECCEGFGTELYDAFVNCAEGGCMACEGMSWKCG